MPPSNDFSAITSIHEDRLQKVEQKTNEISSGLVALVVKQDHLSKQLEINQELMLEKLADMSGILKQRAEDIYAECKHQSSQLTDYHERLVPLEEAAKSGKVRKELFKKIFMAALLAGAGVAGTKLIELIFGKIGG